MYYKFITTKNAKFQVFSSYRLNRNKRSRDKKIFIEGVIPINCALAVGLPVDAVLINSKQDLSNWARDVIQTLQPETAYRVSKALLAEISGKENTPELILIADQPPSALQVADFQKFSKILILDRPASPGNLGTILRSCDAFGVDCVLITGHAVDLYDPKTITASRGTVFKVPVMASSNSSELDTIFKQMKEMYRFRFYGTSAKGDVPLNQVTFAKRSCIIMGNEATGMSHFYRNLADEIVRIPLNGVATSLNIANATSIFLDQLSVSAQATNQ